MITRRPTPHIWIFWLMVAGLFVCLLIPLEYGLQSYRNAQSDNETRAILEDASRVRALLESEINNAAFLATGVESYIVARNGVLDPLEIQRILSLVYERGRHFRNIGIAPRNRITWVFPLAGNENAIGLNYADLPDQWPAIERMQTTRRGLLSGPLQLVQGGRGLIYRAPIFIDDTYWGVLSTVIDADSLFDYLRSAAGELAPALALRHAGTENEPGEVFFGSARFFDQPLEVLPIRVPGTEWQMAIQRPDAHPAKLGWYRAITVSMALVMAVLLGLLVRLVWQRNLLEQLDSEVRKRTAELSQSHDLLDSVLAAARSFAIVATDDQGIIMLFNKGAELMLGYSAEEMVGKQNPGVFLMPSDIRERAQAMEAELGRPLVGDEVFTLRAQQGGEEVLMLHYRHRDGHLIPVQVVVSAIRGSDGDLRGYLGVAEDVSDRLRNETLKNQFISTVSHELRTPLTAISGAVALLRSGSIGAIPDELRPMLDIAFNNSRRLTQLVNDLLDIEKLMAGRITLYSSCHAITDLLQTSIGDLQAMAKQHEVTVTFDSISAANIWVDASRFQQVLTNLLSNAIKFSPAGGAVHVAVTRIPDYVRISVTDQGPGIPPSFYEHVFQRFAQADGSDNRRQAGTGLGLAISKELTEQMGGRIGFESATPGGSCFWVIFRQCTETQHVCTA